ncbi:hypothetical protein N3K66_001948 [Trichothecium roseum]|uniref:Uncharacterized protein n=1 Tax=Trichothecium roseum TaxID=47278 RepID=A0ACC0V884_9HYPO|nr:hypothetical protein N3K66_001948 [Trichothecium roseum]
MDAPATTSIALLLPGLDPQALEASILSANKDITTFVLQCAEGTDIGDCGLVDPFTMAQGPKTLSMHMDYSDEGSVSINDIDCKLDFPNDELDCEVWASYSMNDEPEFESSTRTVMTGLSDLVLDVVVTAGLDKLSDSPATTTADGDATTATSSSDSQETESATEGGASTTLASVTSSSGTTTTTSDATSTPETTDGDDDSAAPKAGLNALLAGVALFVGGALLL